MKLKYLAFGGVLLLTLLQGTGLSEPTVTITLGGDVILGRDGQAIFAEDSWGALTQEQSAVDGSQNWFLVNLESPLGNASEISVFNGEGYNLCAPSEAAEILKIGGVDLVSTANNHREDCDDSADPYRDLEDLSVVLEGQPVVLESPGGTITILAVDAVSKPLDMAALLAAVAETRGKTNLLIVSLHWGVEYAGEPTPLQRDQARQLANAGVDVLWGHHPHVLQPAGWVESEDGKNRMLALYSLGNLLTDQTMTYETRHSALVQLQFKRGEISHLSFQPLVLVHDDGGLVLASPGEDEIGQISKRLGWGQLLESLP